jgi:pseudaminic acid synthase
MNFEELNHVYIIAELSANHCGNFEIAVKTLRAMKASGADAVKLQTFTPDSMTLDSEQDWFQTRKDSLWGGQKLFDLYKKAQTPWEWHEKLRDLAKDLGLDFFTSVFDSETVEKLQSLNVPAYKIASFEITDTPLIQKVAKTGKPVIISTGIATEEDIQLAVETCRKENNNQIALLKCTSAYPAPYNEINLKAIPLLEDMYHVTPGLSDHTLGITVPVAAVSLGAKIIEKHFILDKNLRSVDKDFSLDPAEFKEMVTAVRQTEQAMGRATLELTEKAEKARQSRRSLFVVKNIKKGETLTPENVKSLRPGKGLHPKYILQIIGKKASRELDAGTPLSFNDITG